MQGNAGSIRSVKLNLENDQNLKWVLIDVMENYTDKANCYAASLQQLTEKFSVMTRFQWQQTESYPERDSTISPPPWFRDVRITKNMKKGY